MLTLLCFESLLSQIRSTPLAMKLLSLVLWAGLALVGLFFAVRSLRARATRQRRNRSAAAGSSNSAGAAAPASSSPLIIGFFHPFCNSGGGGERVLWQYVRILQSAFPQALIQIYTGDSESSDEILSKTLSRFGLAVSPSNLSFVRLRTRRQVEASSWPRFTMIGQSLGSMLLAFEALWRSPPHLFIDTTGFAFSYPVASIGFGCSVHAYTHYPTISNEMLDVVWNRRAAHNNSVGVAAGGSRLALLLARAKWLYYKCFALAYSLVGSQASLVFCNSTWTRNHMDSCWVRKPGSGPVGWGLPSDAMKTVYPPCDTQSLQQLPLGRVRTWAETLVEGAAPVNVSARDDQAAKAILSLSASSAPESFRENLIVSLAQFRPEKDHSLQLRAFALFQKQLRELAAQSGATPPKIALVLVGGVRDDGDAARVEALQQLAYDLHISDSVSIRVNQPLRVVHDLLSKALVGMHTMWNEHFGIGVVEFMAAGSVQRTAHEREREQHCRAISRAALQCATS